MILKVLNVLEYGSISPNRTLNVIVEFCNLKFLSIRSNVKRVASAALYKWFAILSQVRRADRKGQSRKIRAEWPSSVWATYFCRYSISGVDWTTLLFSAGVLPGTENCINIRKELRFLNQSNTYLRGRKNFFRVRKQKGKQDPSKN